MAILKVNTVEANVGNDINLDCDVNVLGTINGNTANYYVFPFSGNTSGNCISELFVENIDTCNDYLSVSGNLDIDGNLSADTFYGDSTYMTKSINDVIPSGSGITSVNSYLQYGFNLISTADTTNFCVRLPETPIQGREVTIVNISGADIYVFPSMNGGSVNGVVNGVSIVPSDNRTYKFICYENPNPGAWSGVNTLAAPGIYDSGVISIDTTLSAYNDTEGWVSAANDIFKINTLGILGTNAGYDGLNKPYAFAWLPPIFSGAQNSMLFKPTTPWNFINKVTLYTNMTTGATPPIIFALLNNEGTSYYSAGTTYYMTAGGIGPNPYIRVGNVGLNPWYAGLGQRLAGVPTITSPGFTANPGDPGTYFGELTYSLSGRPSMVGDVLLSSGTMYLDNSIEGPGIFDIDVWNTNYISFQFQTNRNSPDVKFRFLIEYS